MAVYNGTLTKTLSNGDKHHIYPKTTAEIVKYGNSTVKATLDTLTGGASTSGSVANKIATTYATASSVGTVQIGSNINVSAQGVISISVMTGAAAGTDGAVGLVPKPNAGDQYKILRGDGTWISGTVLPLDNTVTSTATDTAATANAVKTAYDAAVTVMTGATANAAGAAGRVPAPAVGDNNSYLRGDGTWVEVPVFVSDSYTTQLTMVVDSAGTEIAHFDEYGNLHLVGNIYAANLPPLAS